MVQAYFARAPWWVLSLVTGLWFGVAMGVFTSVHGRSVGAGLASGAVCGTLFGLVMGPLLVRDRARQSAAAGSVGTDVLRAARRAASSGPVPSDPEVRQTALRLAEQQLRDATGWRRTCGVVTFGGFLAPELVLGFLSSAWFFVAAAFFAGMLALTVWTPGRLRRRAAVLRGVG